MFEFHKKTEGRMPSGQPAGSWRYIVAAFGQPLFIIVTAYFKSADTLGRSIGSSDAVSGLRSIRYTPEEWVPA
jgi:hypothetical protein